MCSKYNVAIRFCVWNVFSKSVWRHNVQDDLANIWRRLLSLLVSKIVWQTLCRLLFKSLQCPGSSGRLSWIPTCRRADVSAWSRPGPCAAADTPPCRMTERCALYRQKSCSAAYSLSVCRRWCWSDGRPFWSCLGRRRLGETMSWQHCTRPDKIEENGEIYWVWLLTEQKQQVEFSWNGGKLLRRALRSQLL